MVVVVLLVAGGLAVFGLGRGPRSSADAPGAAEAAPTGTQLAGLVPGMFVRYRDERLVVERTLEFLCDHERWVEHRLSDDQVGRSLWLEVIERDDVVLTVYERLPLGEEPPGVEALERDGLTYRLVEEGQVSYRSHERAGAGKHGELRYVEYAAGRIRLAYERFDSGPWEVSLGHVVETDDVAVA